MDLLELRPLIPDLSIDFKQDEIDTLQKVFRRDLVEDPFTVFGF